MKCIVRGQRVSDVLRTPIITCAGTEREKSKVSTVLAALDFQSWRVFSCDLDLLTLCAVVQSSHLHIGGDSGGLHVAWMTGASTVTWFRTYDAPRVANFPGTAASLWSAKEHPMASKASKPANSLIMP